MSIGKIKIGLKIVSFRTYALAWLCRLLGNKIADANLTLRIDSSLLHIPIILFLLNLIGSINEIERAAGQVEQLSQLIIHRSIDRNSCVKNCCLFSLLQVVFLRT